MFKKFLFLLLILQSIFIPSKADEGMWLPILLQQLNANALQTAGLKIPIDSIYSINKSSLKDAVVLFGGGCTAEVISGKGLILTNHHCGYSQIQAHSSVEHDYLTDGYWAKSFDEELPCTGLSVTFIIKMEDVTDKIIPLLKNNMSPEERDASAETIGAGLVKKAIEGTHYDAKIRPFFNSNKYFLIVSETFNDIRMVGAPPSAIGKFGADADNWMWPRHTGDFSLFRIYADTNNQSAKYSKANVPYIPRYYFPISLSGVKENDFTMVYGFPGRTQEYLPSSSIELLQNANSPNRIKCREVRLKTMDETMRVNDTVRIQYASKYAGIENAYKKWQGELHGIKNLDVISKKKKFEKEFYQWATSDATRNTKYGKLILDFDSSYSAIKNYSLANDYINEAGYGVELISYAKAWKSLYEMSKTDTVSDEKIKKASQKLIDDSKGFFKNYCVQIDKKLFPQLMNLFAQNAISDLQPDIFKTVKANYKNDFTKYADYLYSKSFMVSQKAEEEFLKSYTKKKSKKLEADPAFQFMQSLSDEYSYKIKDKINPLQQKINNLQMQYMAAQMEYQPEKNFYPDANLTLRLAYGNIKPYFPRDGVEYKYYTTLAGVTEKYDSTNYDFNAPKKLLDLISKKDFGRYAENGEMHVCFIATNHTTGGNSGSPVLNSQGQLIGTNFDRVWEGTMSDLIYDKDQCRNITLDIRYTLFIIDKFANAQRLIDEMKIAN
jgi:hypothetical protein